MAFVVLATRIRPAATLPGGHLVRLVAESRWLQVPLQVRLQRAFGGGWVCLQHAFWAGVFAQDRTSRFCPTGALKRGGGGDGLHRTKQCHSVKHLHHSSTLCRDTSIQSDTTLRVIFLHCIKPCCVQNKHGCTHLQYKLHI